MSVPEIPPPVTASAQQAELMALQTGVTSQLDAVAFNVLRMSLPILSTVGILAITAWGVRKMLQKSGIISNAARVNI